MQAYPSRISGRILILTSDLIRPEERFRSKHWVYVSLDSASLHYSRQLPEYATKVKGKKKTKICGETCRKSGKMFLTSVGCCAKA